MRPEERAWLGDDFVKWRESLRNGYFRALMYHALMEAGVLDELAKAQEPKTVQELADQCQVNAGILRQALTYLSLADSTMEKVGDAFALGPDGEWLLAPGFRGLLKIWVGAYGSSLNALLPALRNEQVYGRDYERDGGATAEGTWFSASHQDAEPTARRMLELGARNVAELACGTAPQLRVLCKLDSAVTGVCMDYSEDALAAARRFAEEEGSAGRMSFHVGDLMRPEEFLTSSSFRDVDAFVLQGALHELLRDGEDEVLRILRTFKEHAPGKLFVIGELRHCSDDDYRARPIFERTRRLAVDHIMHGPLTAQGQPLSIEGWCSLFERAGFQLLEITKSDWDSSIRDIYFLRI